MDKFLSKMPLKYKDYLSLFRYLPKPKKEDLQNIIDDHVPHVCGKCKTFLGYFSAEDDHSGVYILCPGCKKSVYISNNYIQEIIGDDELEDELDDELDDHPTQVVGRSKQEFELPVRAS